MTVRQVYSVRSGSASPSPLRRRRGRKLDRADTHKQGNLAAGGGAGAVRRMSSLDLRSRNLLDRIDHESASGEAANVLLQGAMVASGGAVPAASVRLHRNRHRS